MTVRTCSGSLGVFHEAAYHALEGARPRAPRWRDAAAPMLRQPRLRQAVDDALKFSRVLVRQDARALAQQELRVDLEQLCPGQPRLFQPSEMAVAGGEQQEVALLLAIERLKAAHVDRVTSGAGGTPPALSRDIAAFRSGPSRSIIKVVFRFSVRR